MQSTMKLNSTPVARVDSCAAHSPAVPQRLLKAIRSPIAVCSSSGQSATGEEVPAPTSRRHLLRGISAGILALSLSGAAQAQEKGFLTASGGKGILAQEEEFFYDLRKETEGAVRQELAEERLIFEKEARESQEGKLCATPFGVDVVGITEFVGLLGALVGGISARQRKNEVEKLNEQLRNINTSLRQQARAGTVYAPGLTYVPPLPQPDASLNASGSRPLPPLAATSGTATMALPAVAVASTTVGGLLSMEEESMSPDAVHCRDALRAGKRLLKEQSGAAAMVRFEKALMLSKALKDQVQERRAMRGLAAAARLQQQFKAAIKHLQRVLEISKALGDFTGDADAYGTIADCHTDLGEFDQAAIFYDKYIDRMSRDGPV